MLTITNDIQFIFNKLQKFETYLVGGCVRDSLLHKTPKDFDICTAATTEQIKDAFAGKKLLNIGEKYGTLILCLNGENYEITTFRADGDYSDNRKPDSITFVDSIQEDLSRRDLTINAMAFNQTLVDPFGGQTDLNNQIIRAVGDPDTRFQEDALRILRCIRFACVLNFEIEANTEAAMLRNKSLLANISKERIRDEFVKMITAPSFADKLMNNDAIFEIICEFIPEMRPLKGFEQNNPHHIYDVLEHSCVALSAAQNHDVNVLLACLFHDIGKPHCYIEDDNHVGHFKGHEKVSENMTRTILKRLCFDNNTTETVCALVLHHDRQIVPEKKSIKRVLNNIDATVFFDLLCVKHCDVKAQSSYKSATKLAELRQIKLLTHEILDCEECFAIKHLAINGQDVMTTLDIKPSKIVGEKLNELLQAVIDGDVANTHDALCQKLLSETF